MTSQFATKIQQMELPLNPIYSSSSTATPDFLLYLKYNFIWKWSWIFKKQNTNSTTEVLGGDAWLSRTIIIGTFGDAPEISACCESSKTPVVTHQYSTGKENIFSFLVYRLPMATLTQVRTKALCDSALGGLMPSTIIKHWLRGDQYQHTLPVLDAAPRAYEFWQDHSLKW